MQPPDPDKEEERLAALYRYGLLDTPTEAAFDSITHVAKIALNVPIALITLIDKNRQWFKSRQGVRVLETSRDISFCARTIEGDKPLLIPNLRKDPLFTKNPLVCGFPFLRFYSGVPLRTKDGFNIGSLCILGYRSRRLKMEEITVLTELARLTMDQIELRHIADTDYLMGIATRIALLNAGKREAERARQTGQPLSVALLEIDQFKEISKKFGYIVSDEILRTLVDGCKSVLNDSNFFARVGDGRLAILFPGTSSANAQEVTGKIMSIVEELQIPNVAFKKKLSCRTVVVAYASDDIDFNYFYTRAEIAMQKSERSTPSSSKEEGHATYSIGKTDSFSDPTQVQQNSWAQKSALTLSRLWQKLHSL